MKLKEKEIEQDEHYTLTKSMKRDSKSASLRRSIYSVKNLCMNYNFTIFQIHMFNSIGIYINYVINNKFSIVNIIKK